MVRTTKIDAAIKFHSEQDAVLVEYLAQLEAELAEARAEIEQMRVCKICEHYDSDDLGTDHYCNLGVKPPRPCEKWEFDDGELRVWACPALESAERGEQ